MNLLIKKVLLLILFLINQNINSQNNHINDIVNESLYSYSSYILKNDSSIKKLYISSDDYLRNFEFSNLIKDEKKFEFLSICNVSSFIERKKIKEGLEVVFFDGIDLTNDNKIELKFSYRRVTLKNRKHLFISIIEGIRYTYEYDTESKKWLLKER